MARKNFSESFIDLDMAMAENISLVFIGSVVAHLKHGTACEPICQEAIRPMQQ